MLGLSGGGERASSQSGRARGRGGCARSARARTLAQSDSPAAQRMKAYIARRIARRGHDGARSRTSSLRSGASDPRRASAARLRPPGVGPAARGTRGRRGHRGRLLAWRWTRARGRRPYRGNGRSTGTRSSRRMERRARRGTRRRFDALNDGRSDSVLRRRRLVHRLPVRAPARPRLSVGGLGAGGRSARRAGSRPGELLVAQRPLRGRVHRRLRRARRLARQRSEAGSTRETRSKIAGFVLVVVGLAFAGLLPWPERMLAPGLRSVARVRAARGRCSAAAFAVCAAPCVGVVLVSVLVLAADSRTVVRGCVLLAAYSLGIAVPSS